MLRSFKFPSLTDLLGLRQDRSDLLGYPFEVGFDSDPDWQPKKTLGHGIGDVHGARCPAISTPRGRVVKRHIMGMGVNSIGRQRFNDLPAQFGVGQ